MEKEIDEKVHAWVARFTDVPASVLAKMAVGDADMYSYQSPSLQLIAAPSVVCDRCLYVSDDPSVGTPLETRNGVAVYGACENCGFDLGWSNAEPETFPCGWGTLFAPPGALWFLEQALAVAKLGFFVFESEDYGVLLGIDAGGFDFYEAYWMPLYVLVQRPSADD